MFKKIGLSLLLIVTMKAATLQVGTLTIAYAAPCQTLPQCREMSRETRDNIADIIEEEAALGEEIAAIQADITELRRETSELRAVIGQLEGDILGLSLEISALAEEIYDNLEILEETEARIEILVDQVAQRMRITQRVNNRNTILTLLSEAESLMDFIRTARMFSQIATEDAANMNELTALIAFQDELLATLEAQSEVLQTNRADLEANRAELRVEEARLEEAQTALIALENDMRAKMDYLGSNRINEQERLAAIEAAEEILSRTPPPPVVTQSVPSNNAASTGGNSGGSSAQAAIPSSSGMAHPLPGATVTSEFGPRWGGHHAGIDVEIFSRPSAPILAAASGTVTIATYGSGMGWHVVISHNINGQRVDTLYGHLRYRPPVSAGDVVSQGQQIGTKGATGFVTGPHLHFEVHPGGFSWNNGVDPRRWVNF